MRKHDGEPLVLLTGATGYVGGRLLMALQDQGRRIRCLARRPSYLLGRAKDDTDIVQGDVLDPDALARAMDGVSIAYYLVHSMASATGFEEQDRRAAATFGEAARAAGVDRIVYLGGLVSGPCLSTHLASRLEVGEILRNCGVRTTEFRASVIIGSGSLSFDLVRGLVEELPIMFTGRWVRNPLQPIAIEDVVAYLAAALDRCPCQSMVYEIGGSEQATYEDIMREYARQRHLRRLIIRLPIMSPGLSSLWLGLVTPLYARIGRKIIESVRCHSVVTDSQALRDFEVRPRGYREAIARALSNEDMEFAATSWSDALSAELPKRSLGGVRFGSRIVDSRAVLVPVPPERAFEPIERIGGTTGWYYGDWLWRIRGLLDLAIGGPGMRRGRRNPRQLIVGDTVDCFRVECVQPGRLLLLEAGMRVPGRAWLQFEVLPVDDGSTIRQTAIFYPIGLTGLAYWYALYALHHFVFGGMLRGIARAACRPAGTADLRESVPTGP